MLEQIVQIRIILANLYANIKALLQDNERLQNELQKLKEEK